MVQEALAVLAQADILCPVADLLHTPALCLYPHCPGYALLQPLLLTDCLRMVCSLMVMLCKHVSDTLTLCSYIIVPSGICGHLRPSCPVSFLRLTLKVRLCFGNTAEGTDMGVMATSMLINRDL